MPHKKLIALDFDGVLHSYTSPWTDAATISDGPTEGAMTFLKRLVEDDRFDVVIVSSRCSNPLAVERVEAWLLRHLQEAFGERDGYDLFSSGMRVMQSDEGKLPAFLTLDDRAWNFEGQWPDLDELAAFKPWNKRPAVAPTYDPLPTPQVDLLALFQTVARRAYAAGCDSLEFHEEDCQAEVAQILDDVLGRKVAA